MQYIGLGHLHRPQEILAPARTLYAGSLIELDFGEQEQEKRVVVFEAKPGRPVAVESVPITAGRRLRDVAGTLDELRAQADELGDAFLRVTRAGRGARAGPRRAGEGAAAERARGDGRACRARRSGAPARGPWPRGAWTRCTLFAEYYQAPQRRRAVPQELRQLFDELYEEASR